MLAMGKVKHIILEEESLEESYEKLMEESKYNPSPLFLDFDKNGPFESILHPDYSDYSTSSVSSSLL